MDFKYIKIGPLIAKKVQELGIEAERICKFLGCNEEEIEGMYEEEHLRTDILLRWSKLLEYDLFRLYSQHLVLYAPKSRSNDAALNNKTTSGLPQFRKHIYTREIIDFILELIETGKKTRSQVIEEYGIPKTTLYKWIIKYKR